MLEPPCRGGSNKCPTIYVLSRNEKYQYFLFENFRFLVVKFSVYLNRHVFVMKIQQNTEIIIYTLIFPFQNTYKMNTKNKISLYSQDQSLGTCQLCTPRSACCLGKCFIGIHTFLFLMLSILGRNFSRLHLEIFFLFFPEKRISHFM